MIYPEVARIRRESATTLARFALMYGVYAVLLVPFSFAFSDDRGVRFVLRGAAIACAICCVSALRVRRRLLSTLVSKPNAQYKGSPSRQR